MEEEQRRDEEEGSPEQAAAQQEEGEGPEQDDTDSEVFDTDQHSDAPGPFGTG